MRVAAVNLEALAFLALFVALTVVAWRRFGAPYGLFAALSLALPLSVPSERWPLLSLPRFGLVVFPLFLALATIGGRPRAAHGDRLDQLDPARGRRRPVGALAVGRVAPRHHPMSGRLIGWLSFVLIFSSLNYAARFLVADDNNGTEVAYEYGTSIAALVQYGIVFGIVLLFARGHSELLALRRPTSWLTVLWISVAVLFLMLVLSAALSPITNPEQEQGLVPSHWDSHRIAQFALFAFVVTVVGPVVEELMFRGVGFGLLEFYGRWTAIIGVGVAFGLVHGLIEGLAIITAFGIGLAFLRARTESIYPCMLLHAVFNASALAIGVST